MSSIKTVAVAGASGSLGSVVVEKLLATGKFQVRALRRHGSSATFPAGVDVVDVDFASVHSLTIALKGQDAVVVTTATTAVKEQYPLIDAAVAAGVKRLLPSEFGSNIDNDKARKLPLLSGKAEVADYIIEKTKTSGLTYTSVYNNAFLDWGLEHDFLLRISDYNPVLLNDGNLRFSTTTLSTVADAVVAVLNKPDETRNRAVFVHDLVTTQNELLALAKRVAPEKPWRETHVDLEEAFAGALGRLAEGKVDMETVTPILWRAVFDPAYGGNFRKTDNELLGLKGKTEADVIEILKKYVK